MLEIFLYVLIAIMMLLGVIAIVFSVCAIYGVITMGLRVEKMRKELIK
jgi:hypothetical protein